MESLHSRCRRAVRPGTPAALIWPRADRPHWQTDRPRAGERAAEPREADGGL